MKIDYDTIVKLSKEIHQNNVEAGWWTDLATNNSIVATRNRPELLMLVVSEISEADEGLQNEAFDDKLTTIPMFCVEIADVAIRLFDLIGAQISLHSQTPNVDLENIYVEFYPDYWDEIYIDLVNNLSRAMEYVRKQKNSEFLNEITKVLVKTFLVEDSDLWSNLMSEANLNMGLMDVINAKLEYNKTRPDHKIENRVLSDGKKF